MLIEDDHRLRTYEFIGLLLMLIACLLALAS